MLLSRHLRTRGSVRPRFLLNLLLRHSTFGGVDGWLNVKLVSGGVRGGLSGLARSHDPRRRGLVDIWVILDIFEKFALGGRVRVDVFALSLNLHSLTGLALALLAGLHLELALSSGLEALVLFGLGSGEAIELLRQSGHLFLECLGLRVNV